MKTAGLVGGLPVPPQVPSRAAHSKKWLAWHDVMTVCRVQVYRLSQGVQFLVATPGRLIDLLKDATAVTPALAYAAAAVCNSSCACCVAGLL